MEKIISGIQQMGIGIPNVHEAFDFYRKAFGVDVKVFEEAAEAGLMLPYTGNQPQSRHAILAMNLQGGGGFEIWQYVGRTPQPPKFDVKLGDLGIYICKIKSPNVAKAFKDFKAKGLNVISELETAPNGKPHFYMKDPYNNIFEIVDGYGWFKNENKNTGSVFGAVIGVTDIKKSMVFYKNILGYDTIVYENEGTYEDFRSLPNGDKVFKRVLLRHQKDRVGAFSKLLGPSQIELVQVINDSPNQIFKDRFWGDLGFIHLCFDVARMNVLQKDCETAGHPFTVDSGNSFDMGEAAGHFSYIEDPDGTLIEFVETHKVPIMKKMGWYLNLKKRNPEKSLPTWMLWAMGINKVKD